MRGPLAFLVALSLSIGGCSGAGRTPPAAPPASPTVFVDVEQPKPVAQKDIEPVESGARPLGGVSLEVWNRPDPSAPSFHMKTLNPLNQELTMPINSMQEGVGAKDWYEVLLPDKPNESTGWVRAKDINVVALHERIVIDLSKYTLTHFRDDKVVDRFKVGIGEPQWPTPTGTYYVWARVPQPGSSGPYGAYALGLSAFSKVLTDWPGGGRVAIHGTANPGDTGRKVSHGCIRVFNRDVMKLRRVPIGTPVIIER